MGEMTQVLEMKHKCSLQKSHTKKKQPKFMAFLQIVTQCLFKAIGQSFYWLLFIVSWISGLLCSFFFVSVFILVLVILFPSFLVFSISGLFSPITVCFFIFDFVLFSVPFKTFLIFLVYVLD